MIQLLFAVILAEAIPIMILSFKTPFRKLVIMGLDRVKRGRGPLVAKTVAGTVVAVLMARVYSLVEIQSRSSDAGAVSPTDQVLMGEYLLEASLMGFSLFLAMMIDRLHHYIRELQLLRKSMKIAKENHNSHEVDPNAKHVEAITGLKTKIKQLEFEFEKKEKEAKVAEAHVIALQKQSKGLLLEHNRLQEENQKLRNQLQSIDRRLSHSEGKKKE